MAAMTRCSTSGSFTTSLTGVRPNAEVARVLAPGGRFYFEEVAAHALARRGLVVTGSLTRIRGAYLLGVAARPLPTGSHG